MTKADERVLLILKDGPLNARQVLEIYNSIYSPVSIGYIRTLISSLHRFQKIERVDRGKYRSVSDTPENKE